MRGYLKMALTVLTRRKFFTFISLFGITLTLVVLVVATAILDDIFSPNGPESRFDRALVIYRLVQYGPHSTESMNPGYGFLDKYVLHMPGIERATAFSEILQRTIYRGSARIEARTRRTDANYWQVLNFRFLEGRPFTSEEERRGSFVAVISDELRGKLFDGAPATGRTMELDGQRFTIIGVVPAPPDTRRAAFGDVWVPITTSKSTEYRHQIMGSFNAVVLLHKASDRERVQSAFAEMIPRIPVTDPKQFTGFVAGLDTPFEAFARDMVGGPGLRKFRDTAALVVRGILLLVAVMFMTLPALNLITLNLSRILERAPEIGVRRAFGARRRTLVLQFVMENVILTLIGGLVAYGLAILVLMALNRSGLIPRADFSVNLRVFGYGMLTAAFFGVFSGVYPAWRMSRLDPVNALRGGIA